jgi:hypothetical protein
MEVPAMKPFLSPSETFRSSIFFKIEFLFLPQGYITLSFRAGAVLQILESQAFASAATRRD